MSSDSCSGQPPQQEAVAPQPTPSHTVDHEGLTRVLQPQKKQKMPVIEDIRRMFRRPFTPADMFTAAQQNTPIRFMVNPPEGKDSARLTNVYLDTTTLEWLYQPPIPAISLRNPEYKNLSTVLVLYHPKDPDTVSLPTRSSVQPFAADYYMFTSYIMPEAQLSVSDSAVDGYYNVSFGVTENPSAIYYDYNSFYKRYALYEIRHGDEGLHRIYLKPVFLPNEDPRRNKIIKGVAVEEKQGLAMDFFAFQAFKADVTVYIPDLPVS